MSKVTLEYISPTQSKGHPGWEAKAGDTLSGIGHTPEAALADLADRLADLVERLSRPLT